MQTKFRWKSTISLMGTIVAHILLMQIVSAQVNDAATVTDPAKGEFRATATDSVLSLGANEASAAEIFAEIGRQTGIPVTLYPGANEIVTVEFDRVQLADAFKLITKSVTIVTAEEPDALPHRIARVYVFGTGQSETHFADVKEATPPVAADEPEPEPFEFTFDPSEHIDPTD